MNSPISTFQSQKQNTCYHYILYTWKIVTVKNTYGALNK